MHPFGSPTPKSEAYFLGKRGFTPSHSFPEGETGSAPFSPFSSAQCHLNLVRMPTTGALAAGQRQSREIRRRLTKTAMTSHISEVSQRHMTKAIFDKERYAAFHQSKVPALRKSPAYIVWPKRFPDVLPESTTHSVTSHEEMDDKDTSEEGGNDDGEKHPMSASAAVRAARTVTTTVTQSVTSSDQGREEKSAIMEAFWDNARGSVRIDSMFYGTPRFDPYQSKWPPDHRRCYFISGTPRHHHARPYVPERIMADNVARLSKEKKEVKPTKTFRQKRKKAHSDDV